MSKPRIFVSSTYYDLKYIRGALEHFIKEYGFDPILFEKGHVTYSSDLSPEHSSYKEVQKSDMLLFIVGRSYGSVSSSDSTVKFNSYNSISKEEYKIAIRDNIPTYTFILSEIITEYEVYKLNRNKQIVYSATQTIEVFKLMDFIYDLNENNVVTSFNSIYDIIDFLKLQWAGLFHDFLTYRKEVLNISKIKEAIGDLNAIVSRLEKYNEKIVLSIDPDLAKEIQQEKLDLLYIQKLNKAFEDFCDTTFGRFITTYFDFDNQSHWFEMIMSCKDLNSFLKACDVPEKKIDYILQIESSEFEFLNTKKQLKSIE